MLRSVACALLPVLLPALLSLSCSTPVQREASTIAADGRYDSEFPTQAVSKYLETISQSVLRLNAVAYYKVYTFGSQERIRPQDLNPEVLGAHDANSVYANSSTSGTATVISSEGRHLALLTCAHIVLFPETSYTYFYGQDQRQTPYLAAVSIQKRVSLYIASLPEGGTVELLAADRAADLAVVGHVFENPTVLLPPAVPYALGRSADLEWGTFLYLFGYPSGNRVVTKGIVSSPNKDKRQSFLVDAVFGRGFSGGVCMAMRDGVPNFEIVGIIKMVPARTTLVLTPDKEYQAGELDMDSPYTGKVYVERQTEIEYGFTQATSAESMREFLEEQQDALRRKGFIFVKLLNSPGDPATGAQQ